MHELVWAAETAGVVFAVMVLDQKLPSDMNLMATVTSTVLLSVLAHVVLEMNDPATGASGRNGGSLVMGRYYAMVLKLLEDYWRRMNQHGDDARRRRLGEKFASAYCAAAYRNAELIAETVRTEGFACDYQRRGWIQLRTAEQQAALSESVDLAERVASGIGAGSRRPRSDDCRASEV